MTSSRWFVIHLIFDFLHVISPMNHFPHTWFIYSHIWFLTWFIPPMILFEHLIHFSHDWLIDWLIIIMFDFCLRSINFHVMFSDFLLLHVFICSRFFKMIHSFSHVSSAIHRIHFSRMIFVHNSFILTFILFFTSH